MHETHPPWVLFFFDDMVQVYFGLQHPKISLFFSILIYVHNECQQDMVLPVELFHAIDNATWHGRCNWNARQWFATQMLNHVVNCLCVGLGRVRLWWLVAFVVEWLARNTALQEIR